MSNGKSDSADCRFCGGTGIFGYDHGLRRQLRCPRCGGSGADPCPGWRPKDAAGTPSPKKEEAHE